MFELTAHDKANEFVEQGSLSSIQLSPYFLCSISIVSQTKLLSNHLNAFCKINFESGYLSENDCIV